MFHFLCRIPLRSCLMSHVISNTSSWLKRDLAHELCDSVPTTAILCIISNVDGKVTHLILIYIAPLLYHARLLVKVACLSLDKQITNRVFLAQTRFTLSKTPIRSRFSVALYIDAHPSPGTVPLTQCTALPHQKSPSGHQSLLSQPDEPKAELHGDALLVRTEPTK